MLGLPISELDFNWQNPISQKKKKNGKSSEATSVGQQVEKKEGRLFRERKKKKLRFESLTRRLKDQTLFILTQIWCGDSLRSALQS